MRVLLLCILFGRSFANDRCTPKQNTFFPCFDGWLSCCPGGDGSYRNPGSYGGCTSADCSNPGVMPCEGTWMEENCAAMCNPCPDDVDCVVTWDDCTSDCESAADRTYTIQTAQSGSGAACPNSTPQDCQPGDGTCHRCTPRQNTFLMCFDGWVSCCPGGDGSYGGCFDDDCSNPGVIPCEGLWMEANCPAVCNPCPEYCVNVVYDDQMQATAVADCDGNHYASDWAGDGLNWYCTCADGCLIKDDGTYDRCQTASDPGYGTVEYNGCVCNPCEGAACPEVSCWDGSEPPVQEGECCGDLSLCPVDICAACPEHSTCKFVISHDVCVCDSGFSTVFTNDGIECSDTNECAMNSHSCAENEQCINTVGSYECQGPEYIERKLAKRLLRKISRGVQKTKNRIRNVASSLRRGLRKSGANYHQADIQFVEALLDNVDDNLFQTLGSIGWTLQMRYGDDGRPRNPELDVDYFDKKRVRRLKKVISSKWLSGLKNKLNIMMEEIMEEDLRLDPQTKSYVQELARTTKPNTPLQVWLADAIELYETLSRDYTDNGEPRS